MEYFPESIDQHHDSDHQEKFDIHGGFVDEKQYKYRENNRNTYYNEEVKNHPGEVACFNGGIHYYKIECQDS